MTFEEKLRLATHIELYVTANSHPPGLLQPIWGVNWHKQHVIYRVASKAFLTAAFKYIAAGHAKLYWKSGAD